MIQNPNIYNVAQQQAANNGVVYGEGGYPSIPTDLKSVEATVTDNNTVAKKAVGMTDLEVLMKMPIVFGIVYGLQMLLAKRFSGKFGTSIFGKVEKFADSFAQSKFVEPALKKLYQGFDKAKDGFRWLAEKSKVAKSMAMGTKAEFGFAKPIGNGVFGFGMGDAFDMVRVLQKKYPNLFAEYTEDVITRIREMPTKEDALKLIKKLSEIPDEKIWVNSFAIEPKRLMYPSQTINTLRALIGEGEAKTRFGKGLSKFFIMVTEAMTGGMVGGAFSIAGQSLATAYAYERSNQAPKGEKLATGMEEFMQQVAFFGTMPFAMKLMHMFGGLKYAGLDEAGKEAYQKALKDINTKIDSGVIKDKAALKTAKQELSKLLNNGTKWHHKPFKWAGNFVAYGLERLRPLKDSKWARVKHFTKGFGGGALRLVLYGAVFGAMLSNPFIRLSHLIFGKPTDSILDSESPEEKELKKKENAKVKLDDVFVPQSTHNQQQNPFTPQQTQQIQQGQQVQSHIPASNLNEPKRTYVPSPVAVNYPTQAPVKQEQMDMKTQEALMKADMLEQEAIKLLGNQGMTV